MLAEKSEDPKVKKVLRIIKNRWRKSWENTKESI